MENRSTNDGVSRREFVASAGGAAVATWLGGSGLVSAAQGRRRYAIVGTGVRAVGMWGRPLARQYGDVVEFVGLCDSNPLRLEAAKRQMDVSCPTFTDFDGMVTSARPDLLMVTTVDAHHAGYIVRALDRGIDVIVEKPMVTDEKQCQAVLDAEKRAGRQIVVTFNYRYAPKHQKIPWETQEETEMYLIRNFGKREKVELPDARGGHGGGDQRLLDSIFRNAEMPPYMKLPGSRAGAMSCLTGIAALKSCDAGGPVKISDLVSIA